MRRLSGAVLVALATANCTVGPNYHVPAHATANTPSANGAFVNGGEAAFAQAPLPDHWWRLYDAPRLDSYVREALAANTDLRAADANLRRATFAIREAQAAQTVSTVISGTAADTRADGIDILSFPGYSYSLGGAISYPLDLAGGIRRAVEATRVSAEAVQASRDQVRVTVAAAITRNYVTVCSANRSLAAAEHVVAIERQTLDEVRRLFQGGRATAFDVTRVTSRSKGTVKTDP